MQMGSIEESQAVVWAMCHVTWCLRSKWRMRRPGSSCCSRASYPQQLPQRRQVCDCVSQTFSPNTAVLVLLFCHLKVIWLSVTDDVNANILLIISSLFMFEWEVKMAAQLLQNFNVLKSDFKISVIFNPSVDVFIFWRTSDSWF